MNARMALRRQEDELDADHDPFGWKTARLAHFIRANADRHARQPALNDQPNRLEWSQLVPNAVSYSQSCVLVAAFIDFLNTIGLAPQSNIGIFLPNGSEACLAIMAIEQAGMTPCLLPIDAHQAEIAAAVESVNMQAVITQSVLCDLLPAEMMRHVAARYYGLRFICAFGSDVPDGVISLDSVFASLHESETEVIPDLVQDEEIGYGSGLITFSRVRGVLRAVHRSNRSLVASAVTYLAATRIEAGDRIVSLLPPDDLAGLTTGLTASVLSGASLEMCGLFDSESLRAALLLGPPAHLVVPGWMEEAFEGTAKDLNIKSLTLVHQLPVSFRARPLTGVTVADVLSIGEYGIICKARDNKGMPSFSLADLGEKSNAALRDCLQLRLNSDNMIEIRGLACEMRPFRRGEYTFSSEERDWYITQHKAETFAGLLIGVS
jgi:mycobactin salicyl-AMP ligase